MSYEAFHHSSSPFHYSIPPFHSIECRNPLLFTCSQHPINGEFLCSNNSLNLSFNKAHSFIGRVFFDSQSTTVSFSDGSTRARRAETRRLDCRLLRVFSSEKAHQKQVSSKTRLNQWVESTVSSDTFKSTQPILNS